MLHCESNKQREAERIWQELLIVPHGTILANNHPALTHLKTVHVCIKSMTL